MASAAQRASLLAPRPPANVRTSRLDGQNNAVGLAYLCAAAPVVNIRICRMVRAPGHVTPRSCDRSVRPDRAQGSAGPDPRKPTVPPPASCAAAPRYLHRAHRAHLAQRLPLRDRLHAGPLPRRLRLTGRSSEVLSAWLSADDAHRQLAVGTLPELLPDHPVDGPDVRVVLEHRSSQSGSSHKSS